MALRTTALLSVVAVILSIVAHQSDPDIIPSLLAQGLDTFNEVTKKISHYYDGALSYVHQTTGLNFFNVERNKPIIKEKEKGKKGNKPSSKGSNKQTLFTKEELKQYNGEKGSKGVYVAVLGGVFDVESGIQHYGPGGGYHFFSGIDGSRAFVSGDFTETGLIDDVTGLPPKDLKALHGWYKFYEKDYTYVGKVVGRFYDSNGKRTPELDRVLRSVKEYERQEALENEEKKVYPPCNVEWDKERGSRVWCSPKSGGVVRSWAGVPRQLFEGSGKKSRCTCVEPKTAVSDPNLKEYKDCPPGEDSCWVVGTLNTVKMNAKQLIALDFEVFGMVQGVFFRKYTVQTGKKLGLRGWCMNTHHDTVLGQMEGERPAVEEMKKWLSTTGSPSSRIDKAEFRNEKVIQKYSFDGFTVHH